jgi:hypothetical protein
MVVGQQDMSVCCHRNALETTSWMDDGNVIVMLTYS